MKYAANAAAVADDSFTSGAASFSSDSAGAGTLADDASLAALREKLSSNN